MVAMIGLRYRYLLSARCSQVVGPQVQLLQVKPGQVWPPQRMPYSSAANTVTKRAPPPPIFNAHREIFSGRSNGELWRALLVLQACAVGPLVTYSEQLLQLGRRVLGARGLAVAVAPLYAQFVAGDSEEELRAACHGLRRSGVRLMLAPMLEGGGGTHSDDSTVLESNLPRMLMFIFLTARHGRTADGRTRTAPPICQAKLTGHLSARILEKLSWQYRRMNSDHQLAAVRSVAACMATVEQSLAPHMDLWQEIKQDAIASDSLTICHSLASNAYQTDYVLQPNGHQDTYALDINAYQDNYVEKLKTVTNCLKNPTSLEPEDDLRLLFQLTEIEHKQLKEALRRISLFGMLAEHLGVVLAMDAEFTYVNSGISLITLALMSRHCMKKPIVWNTYQAYLKRTPCVLHKDMEVAAALGCCFGVKLVRGAYLEHEKLVAQLNGFVDPINESYERTSQVYNLLAWEQLDAVARSPETRAVLIASHNEESIRLALHKMAVRSDSTKWPQFAHHTGFAQVYGMAENISVPLALSGELVYKSVPVGSLVEVLPYLARRAQENRAVLKGARKERQLLFRELRDRMLRRSRNS